MAHIGEESTFQAVRFFCTVLSHPQVFFRLQQIVLQTFGAEIVEERDAQTQHKDEKQCTRRPNLISILLIEWYSLINNLHIKRKDIRVQSPLLHLPAVQYGLAANHGKVLLFIRRILINLYRCQCHVLSQFPVIGQHSADRPIPQAHRWGSKSRNGRSNLHHGISSIPHEITFVHIHTPRAYHDHRILR